MGSWAWFVLGIVAGVVGYLLVGNALAFRQHRQRAAARFRAREWSYIATRTRGRAVNFKGEDEAEGEAIGPVFITDDHDADFLHEIGWMKISGARELAQNLGHAFNHD